MTITEYEQLLDKHAPGFKANTKQIGLDPDQEFFIMMYPFSEEINFDLKYELPNRKYDPDIQQWKVNAGLENLPKLIKIADKHNFTWRPAAYKFAKQMLKDIRFLRANSARLEGYRIQIPGWTENPEHQLKPFQHIGVGYAVRSKRCIIGDPVGLGKTIESIATIAYLNAFPAVVVCRASQKLQWEDEIHKFLPGITTEVIDSECPTYSADVEIISYDTLKLPLSWYIEENQRRLEFGKRQIKLPRARIADHYQHLFGRQNQAIILDELHLVKNHKSQRGMAAKELSKGVGIVLGLTGTMVLNRPSELIHQLEILRRLEDFGGWFYFAKTYCGLERTAHGLDISGASNGTLLNRKMRSICYIRREKRDIYKELPEVQPTRVRVEVSNKSAYQKAEKNFLKYLEENEGRTDVGQGQLHKFAHMEKLFQLSAQGKLKAMEEWISSFVDVEEKLIVFAHHKNIQAKALEVCDRVLKEQNPAYYATSLFAGDNQDQEINKALFQQDENCRIMVASISVGGTGHTLTAATNLLFMEMPWTPSEIDQCVGRAYGRVNDMHGVNAYFLIGNRTIDDEKWYMIEGKRNVTTQIITGRDNKQRAIHVNQEEVIERFKARAMQLAA